MRIIVNIVFVVLLLTGAIITEIIIDKTDDKIDDSSWACSNNKNCFSICYYASASIISELDCRLF